MTSRPVQTVEQALAGAQALRPFARNWNERALVLLADEVLRLRAAAEPPMVSPADALLGLSWWNTLSRPERAYWLERAGSAAPADAWMAYKMSVT